MADVEVDLLVDLEEARRRLGEFRRDLDGVERQAEEIQDRPGGPRPGGAAADETGRRQAGQRSRAARERSKFRKEIDALKSEVDSVIEATEEAADKTSGVIRQVAHILRARGFGETATSLDDSAKALTKAAKFREVGAASLAAGIQAGTDLAQGGITPTPAMIAAIVARQADDRIRAEERKAIVDSLRAHRGGDAVARLVAEALGGG